MSKFCSNCGKELEENAKFCDSCGTKIEATEIVKEETPVEDNPIQEEVKVGEVANNEEGKTNGLAIASLVLSIVSMVNIFRTICGILGLIFGIVSFNKIKQTGEKGKGMAIAGIAVSATSLALELILIATGALIFNSLISLF